MHRVPEDDTGSLLHLIVVHDKYERAAAAPGLWGKKFLKLARHGFKFKNLMRRRYLNCVSSHSFQIHMEYKTEWTA